MYLGRPKRVSARFAWRIYCFCIRMTSAPAHSLPWLVPFFILSVSLCPCDWLSFSFMWICCSWKKCLDDFYFQEGKKDSYFIRSFVWFGRSVGWCSFIYKKLTLLCYQPIFVCEWNVLLAKCRYLKLMIIFAFALSRHFVPMLLLLSQFSFLATSVHFQFKCESTRPNTITKRCQWLFSDRQFHNKFFIYKNNNHSKWKAIFK